ncbi:MAG: hypothetical protein WCI60_03795 [bacterium]|jgi:hypothetical protein
MKKILLELLILRLTMDTFGLDINQFKGHKNLFRLRKNRIDRRSEDTKTLIKICS